MCMFMLVCVVCVLMYESVYGCQIVCVCVSVLVLQNFVCGMCYLLSISSVFKLLSEMCVCYTCSLMFLVL